MLYLGFFAVVLLLRFWTITQPPVWDGTASVFPAAAYLADHGFDYSALLEQPGYVEGGPNVHSLSSVTLVTAVAVRLLGGSSLLFPALHLLHFALGAAVGVGVYRIARFVFAERLSLLIAACSLVVPVVATQLGDMYLELPVMAASVWAAVWWLEGRLPAAVVMAAVAVTAKESGLIIAGGIGIAAVLTAHRTRTSRTPALWFFAVPGAVALVLRLVLGETAVADQSFSFELLLTRLLTSIGFLVRTMDVLLLLVVYVLLRPAVAERPIPAADGARTAKLESLSRSVLGSFGLLYLFTGGYNVSLIPRYLVLIVPFLLVGLALLFARITRPATLEIGFAVAIAVFAVNTAGLLYPPAGTNSFAVVERSAEYRDLLALHQATTDAVESVPAGATVFYTLAEHYRLAYPVSGYVDEAFEGGVNVYFNPPYDRGSLTDFPADFYVVVDHLGLGGRALYDVWQQAEAEDGYDTAVTTLTSGEFTARIVHIRQNE